MDGTTVLLTVMAGGAGLIAGALVPSMVRAGAQRLFFEWQEQARATLELPTASAMSNELPHPTFARRLFCAAALAACWAGLALTAGPSIQALAYAAFLWALLALTMFDLDHMLLPDVLTLPLLWAGLLLSSIGVTGVPLTAAVWGATLGYLSLWIFYWAFRLATGKEGLGYGDFKLLAAFGAWCGPLALAPIVAGASVIGAAVGVYLRVRRGNTGPLPFGPSLAFSASAYAFVQLLLSRA